MERMRRAALYRSTGRDKRLADDLPTEDPLPSGIRALPTEEIFFEFFKIEDC